MTALWTIEEMPVVAHTLEALERAADTMVFEREKQYLNRHCWDRKDSRERIKKSLNRSIQASERLLRMMHVTAERELGR